MKVKVYIFLMLISSSLLAFESAAQLTDKAYQSAALYGTASFYADDFHGKRTASGQRFYMQMMTAACNVLPLGSMVMVVNTKNNKSVIVRINDRLSKTNRRILDLSMEAANKLDFVKQGLTTVRVEIISMGER